MHNFVFRNGKKALTVQQKRNYTASVVPTFPCVNFRNENLFFQTFRLFKRLRAHIENDLEIYS